jgi:hypothetical protein
MLWIKGFSEPTFAITIYPLPIISSDYFVEDIFVPFCNRSTNLIHAFGIIFLRFMISSPVLLVSDQELLISSYEPQQNLEKYS